MSFRVAYLIHNPISSDPLLSWVQEYLIPTYSILQELPWHGFVVNDVDVANMPLLFRELSFLRREPCLLG